MKTQFELVDDFAQSMKDELVTNEHLADSGNLLLMLGNAYELY